MFKLLVTICAGLACSLAWPQPEGSYTIKSLQTIAAPTVLPAPLQTNAVSDEHESDEAPTVDDASISPAPAAASAPAAVTRLAAASDSPANSVSASASARSPSILVAATVKSSPPSVALQHHILPAETIPLPITIATRSGIRTVIAPETITISEPAVAKVGEVVQKIPTAVSHQSQTVVHKHARIVTPIVAPAVRTITSQVLRAYHTPLVIAPQSPIVRVISN